MDGTQRAESGRHRVGQVPAGDVPSSGSVGAAPLCHPCRGATECGALRRGGPSGFRCTPGVRVLVLTPRRATEVEDLSRHDGKTPVASGAMFIDRGWAWMGIDATLPACRRQGAQAALLSRRISDGHAAGVEGFTGETDRPAGGTKRLTALTATFFGPAFALPTRETITACIGS